MRTEEDISKILDSMGRRYFPQLECKLKGLYYKDSSEIAVRDGVSDMLYNKKHLNIRPDQLERVLVHELQHVQDFKDAGWNENNESHYVYGFIFHPNFQDLYKRLEGYYKKKSEEGVELRLGFSSLPKNFKELSELGNNYASPTEILARLRGYEHYLNQVSEGMSVETLPFESIEAFKKEDIEFLDIEHRKELASELKEKNPEIFEREERGKISIELGE